MRVTGLRSIVPMLLLLALVGAAAWLGTPPAEESPAERPPAQAPETRTPLLPPPPAPRVEEEGPLPAPANDPAVVRGLVTDAAGKPLGGVAIAVLPPAADWRRYEPMARTGAGGRFSVVLRSVRPGQPLRVVADLVAEDLMERYAGDPKLRRPCQGRVTTDRDGCFRDTALRPGLYRLTAVGEMDAGDILLVREGVAAGEREVHLRFPGFGSMDCTFEDARTGKKVWVNQGRERMFEFVHPVSEEEEFFIELPTYAFIRLPVPLPLPEGWYRVHVEVGGYRPFLSDLFRVNAGDRLGPLRFRLEPQED